MVKEVHPPHLAGCLASFSEALPRTGSIPSAELAFETTPSMDGLL